MNHTCYRSSKQTNIYTYIQYTIPFTRISFFFTNFSSSQRIHLSEEKSKAKLFRQTDVCIFGTEKWRTEGKTTVIRRKPPARQAKAANKST